MGKGEEELGLPESVLNEAQIAQNAGGNSGRGCCFLRNFVSFRCVFVLLFGAAVFLSALFWLPFFHSRDQDGVDLDSEFRGRSMVASFKLNKSASILDEDILQLQDDIFSIISFSNTKVEVISLESPAGTNTTDVIFAVESDATSKSLIRDAFVSIILNQSSLHLTTSLFGDPFSFEVLKFIGGITVSPPQSAFLMQKVQILFNFTLNFSIEQLINNFGQLQGELKSGIHLAPYENLYISLTNEKGSTIARSTIVRCQVLLAVGINPSMSRIKQLAQTISGSHTKNLGLNNTVFGRVKQVRLSSILQHSLGSPSPSPAPSPMVHSHHHNHHHHHHDHHKDSDFAPTISPSPSHEYSHPIISKNSPSSAPIPTPAPRHAMSHKARPPGCQFGHKSRYPGSRNEDSHLSPISPPALAPKIAPSRNRRTDSHRHMTHGVPASSPLPNVIFAHVHPPSERDLDAEPPDLAPAVSPSESSSSVCKTFSIFWASVCCLFVVLHL